MEIVVNIAQFTDVCACACASMYVCVDTQLNIAANNA